MHESNCPDCGKSMRLPDGSAGKKIKCSDCGAISPILELDDGGLGLQQPGTDDAELRCAECDAPLRGDAAFCVACGAAIAGETRGELADAASDARAERARARTRARGGRAQRANSNKMKKAAVAILIVSILFFIGGTFFGLKAWSDAQEPLEQLSANFEPSEEIVLDDGEVVTASELGSMIRGEVAMIFVLLYGLAAIMLGLFFWARKSPLPATISALSVYVVVLAIDAAFDPTTIYRGIILKVIIIAMMFGGISAALKERAAEQRGARRVSAKRTSRRTPPRRSAAQ